MCVVGVTTIIFAGTRLFHYAIKHTHFHHCCHTQFCVEGIALITQLRTE